MSPLRSTIQTGIALCLRPGMLLLARWRLSVLRLLQGGGPSNGPRMEVALAREVQARLFPRNDPEFESFDCAGKCLPARHVGGDYYDFLDLGAGESAWLSGTCPARALRRR